jgi:hypothetical protein
VSTELETIVGERGGRARFLVATDDRDYRERLPHMGYLPAEGDRFATRWFVAPAATRGYYELCGVHRIDGPTERPPRARAVAGSAARGLEPAGRERMTWWLYGSAALAIRGIAVEPGDIDINLSDCMVMGRIFDDLLVTPVERMHGWVARCGGRAFAHATIEWISEPLVELDDPTAPHEQGPFIESELETVAWYGRMVRVPPLTAQLRVCDLRGLTERVGLIRGAIRSAAA